MNFIVKKAVASYFDALITHNLQEKEVTNLKKTGNTLIIETIQNKKIETKINNFYVY